MTITALMAIAHIVELSVCVDEVSSEVIGHRQAGIEINLHTTIECLVAHASDISGRHWRVTHSRCDHRNTSHHSPTYCDGVVLR